MRSHLALSFVLLILTCLCSLSQCDRLLTNKEKESRILNILPFNVQKDELLVLNNDNVSGTKDQTKGHKGLLPLDGSDWLAFTLEALALMVAAGGGIGGGGILVPIYTIVLGFRTKHAIPLSNVSVLGGAIANVILNWSKRHPSVDRPLIDWDIVLLLQPALIAGSLIGAVMNKLIPELILVIMLVVILSITALKTFSKGIALFKKENEERRLRQGTSDNEIIGTDEIFESSIRSPTLDSSPRQDFEPESYASNVESKVSLSTPLLNEEQDTNTNSMAEPVSDVYDDEQTDSLRNEILISERKTSFIIVFAVVQLFVVIITLNILKGGGGEPSPLGIQCGSVWFWLIQGFMLVWILVMTVIAQQYLLRRTKFKKEVNYPFRDDDIVWDSQTSLVYPLLCVIAGLCAGMFGIGGGIFVGPIMLALNVHPFVVAATSATMNLFTSFTVTTSYIVFGLLTSNYAFVVAIIALFSTLAGQLIMNELIKRTGRYSYITFIIGFTVVISAILMAIQAIFPTKERNQRSETAGICTEGV